MTLRVAVAEDEPLNRRRMVRLLEDCGCEVAATFVNGLEVEEWLREGNAVDALFLDIQMPDLDGLSLRASLPPELPVVFVTAHAQHAVEAFEVEALDFILKPVTTARLAKALDRVRRALAAREPKAAPAEARGGEPRAGGTRYPVQAGGGVVLMDLQRTAYFEVEEQVVWAFPSSGSERLRTRWKTLGEVEAHFPDAGLLRIHRHLLIRPEAVLGMRSTGGGARVLVRMAGGAEVEASRGATPKLKERLGLE